ncbi:UNVERIFIED_CONTAM: hypothetical protein K2H54_015881 [Gekko kuhli]
MASDYTELDLESTQPQESLTKQDLCELREDLLAAMSSMVANLLQPVQLSINNLRKDIKEASQIAENASEMALMLQEEGELNGEKLTIASIYAPNTDQYFGVIDDI